MALPTGLLPVLVFALTAGVGLSVTLVAHLIHRRTPAVFSEALREAVLSVGLVYLVGVVAVWGWAGFGSLWGVPALLVGAGMASLVAFLGVPLAVGRWVVRRGSGVDGQTALRFATDGWLVTMLLVFGVFIAPGGPLEGHLLDLEGPRTCLVGFCGISVRLLAAVVLELLIAVLGPGVIGLAIHAQRWSSAAEDTQP